MDSMLMLGLIGCFFLPGIVVTQDIRMPPTIIKSSVSEKIYRQDDEISLECVAEGIPQPEYEWLKNGVLIPHGPNIMYPQEGVVQIKPLTSLDEGYYQCRASNIHGVALSNVTVLQRAVLQPYGQPAIDEKRDLVEGQPYKLSYIPTKCVPRPTFMWGIANDIVDKSQVTVVTGNRIQIDDDGNLHFSYLTMDDMRNSKLYKCNVYNPHLDLTHGGSYSRLIIKSAGGVKPFGPVYAFSSPTPVVSLEGRNTSLRCFFSGFPEPTLTWSKVGGSMPIGRYSLDRYNTELIIRNVQQSDEGDYMCRAANTNGNQDHVIQIDVQVSPIFRSLSHRPRNLNVTEGDTVNISCNAAAEPQASVVWMKNGAPLNAASLPPRMRLTKSGTQLTILNVCKQCEDGTSDLQVIQCNASNVHGYAFGDGYINVLLKTQITDSPVNVDLAHNETSAEFHCAAVSDDSTPVTVKWFRVDTEGYETPVRNDTLGRVRLSSDSTLLSLTVPENSTKAWAKLTGLYRCRASNGYSQEFADAALTVGDAPVALPEVTAAPAIEEKLISSSMDDLWLWLVLLAAILLVIILLICCCICLQRRKGDTYKVDEKERNNGNDPEKELANSGFHDYRRPDSDLHKGSRASLVSSTQTGSEEDDASSLNEYGDIDAGKFNEDGSFIGDYGTANRPNNRPPKRDRTTETFA